MPIRSFHYSFNGGEVSPRFQGRLDHQRYFSSVGTCENFITSPVGGVDRRPGTRFLARTKFPERQVRLMPFEFNVEQAYVIEAGHQYMRFYRNRQRLDSPPGNPIEVATPYLESELFDLQTAQSADVMWIVHPAHPPHKLLRFSDTQWAVQPIPFDPPPSVEAPEIMGVVLTMNALNGQGVNVVASGAIFLDGDIGRQITLIPSQGSQARATITALNTPAPSDQITINITSPFPSVTLVSGSWRLEGPLGVGLQIIAVGPEPLKGTFAKGHLQQRNLNTPELITNGSGESGMSGWTEHSGDVLASGSHTGGTGANIQDTSKHFPALGVRVGMRGTNTTNGNSGVIQAITPDGRSLVIGTPPAFTINSGNGYQVTGTGGVQVASNGFQLSGGNAGTGWIEQGITTELGHRYQIVFDVAEGPISIQVGSFPTGTNVMAEASFPIGLDQEATFTALSNTSYIQIRNNQPTMSRVSGISVHQMTARGWRPTDVGKFVKAFSGVFEIVGFDNDFVAILLIRTPPETLENDAAAGAWQLEVPAWSASRGYPRAISFHQQRLGFAGTAMQPLTVWQSETGNYEQFGASALADSSLEQEFSANAMNVIQWMEPFRDLLIGTAAAEHLLRGVNGPLNPSNGEQLPQTKVGSESLPPIRADNALILLMRGGRQIRGLEYDANGAVVRGKDHTLIADHITSGGIVQWAMQTKPQAILWAVRGDGTLAGLTYEQFEEVQGWHRHTTQGAFESVCVIPVAQPSNEQTEEVYVSVQRQVIGSGLIVERFRCVEILDPAVSLDSAISYAGPATPTITGLDHLEGKTVSIVDKSAGADQPALFLDRVVASGTISLEIPVTAADVGLANQPRLTTLRPEIPLADGTIQGQMKRWIHLTARCLRTGGLLINGKETIYRTPDDAMDEGLILRDGDFEVMELGSTVDGLITLEPVGALPCTIVALYGQLDVEED